MNQDQLELVQMVNRFCSEKIEPHMEHDDKEQTFRKEIFDEIGSLGLAGIPISSEFGGAEMKYEDLCFVLEEMAKFSVAYAVTLSVSSMVQGILEQFGTTEQKAKYLPTLTSGEGIGAFCLSESHAGSDAASLKTTAKKDGDSYILNGTKMWISSGGISETYIVMARTGEKGAKGVSAFIVPKDSQGLSFGKKEDKMGWRVSPTREVIFENVKVPAENLIGNEGEGFNVAMAALNRGRITIGSIAVGLAQRALDEAVKYSLERKQFGKSLFEFQGLNWMMADMATEIEASRLLVQKAAYNFDNGISDVKLASMAKMKATDVAMKVTTDAVQIHGGVGYTKEYPVERYMRDAKVLQIVEGTNQIQKVVIARELSKTYNS